MSEMEKREKENCQTILYRRYKMAGLGWKKVASRVAGSQKSNKTTTNIFASDGNRRKRKSKGDEAGIRIKKQSNRWKSA